jgi:alcohol dehydrogenase class IV
MIEPFQFTRLPRIDFGIGRVEALPDAIARHGHIALIVTGARAFRDTPRWAWLLTELARREVESHAIAVSGEPTPAMVDEAVDAHRDHGTEVVVGIGGGSVIDTAKAIAGLLRTGTSVRDHLEGFPDQQPYPGPSVPLIAVPTTAGTGSEATKNAVLSEVGPQGFKRSFRDERLVAVEAIVDPDLLLGNTPVGAASNGADALTQLIESYVSTRATPITDALALRGLEALRSGLLPWHRATVEAWAPETSADARSAMALAALLSGICLAQSGLGAIHGLASPLGAMFPIPHGVACGALMVATVETNLLALERRSPGSPALVRYATIGRALADLPTHATEEDARAALVATLRYWVDELEVPRLGSWGVETDVIDTIVAGARGSSMRTNPIILSDDEIAGILQASI